MNCEISIDVNQQPISVYMQEGFFEFEKMTVALHKHMYAEIHIILEGELLFQVGKHTIELKENETLFIPQDTLHCIRHKAENTKKVAFQIKIDSNSNQQMQVTVISKSIILELCNEIHQLSEYGNSDKLRPLLSLICVHFFQTNKSQTPHSIQDRGFIIHEFFSRNYSQNVSISDIAKKLHLCNKQAEREIKKYTKMSFRENLTQTRIETAQFLLEYEKLSLSQVCELVGYRSYSGFWKALKKFGYSPDCKE